jgi:hypothetical protein
MIGLAMIGLRFTWCLIRPRPATHGEHRVLRRQRRRVWLRVRVPHPQGRVRQIPRHGLELAQEPASDLA